MAYGKKRTELALVVTGSLVLAAGFRLYFKSEWIELAAFVTGWIAVYLSIKENIWFFSIGIVSSILYAQFFFWGRLFADTGLQIYFAAMLGIGWWSWLHGGPDRSELRVARMTRKGWLWTVAATVIGTAVLIPVLSAARGSSVFWDASLTSLSFAAQMVQNRKLVENWLLWIIANVCYVPLFLTRGYYATAILFLIFLLLAVMGHKEWNKKLAAGAVGGDPNA